MQAVKRIDQPMKEHAHARTCVGCGVRAERPDTGPKGAFELVRFALLPAGEDGAIVPVVDLRASSFGRGAWVHPRKSCLEQAARRGLSRSSKSNVRVDAGELCRQIVEAAAQRAERLIAVGVRSHKAVIGTTAANAAGKVVLWVVANDAAARDSSEIAGALVRGDALMFGSKDSLGAACGRELAGTVAITDVPLASAVRGAIVLSQAAASIRGGSKQ